MSRWIDTIVLDLDNTLWDWYTHWHLSFSWLVAELWAKYRIPQEDTLAKAKQVFGRTKSADSLEELLMELPLPDAARQGVRLYLRTVQRHTLSTYGSVYTTLERLRYFHRVQLTGYTGSQERYAIDRLANSRLLDFLDHCYCSPAGDPPSGASSFISFADKPSSSELARIIANEDTTPARTLVVGDSLQADIAPAQQLGCMTALAAYGARNPQAYELLVQVTPMSQNEVDKQRSEHDALQLDDIIPDVVLTEFSALLGSEFTYVPHLDH